MASSIDTRTSSFSSYGPGQCRERNGKLGQYGQLTKRTGTPAAEAIIFASWAIVMGRSDPTL